MLETRAGIEFRGRRTPATALACNTLGSEIRKPSPFSRVTGLSRPRDTREFRIVEKLFGLQGLLIPALLNRASI